MLKMQIFTSSTVHKQTQSPNSILAKSCEKPERLHNVLKLKKRNSLEEIFLIRYLTLKNLSMACF